MYVYDLNEILFLNECHYLVGFIEGLETVKRLLDIYSPEKTKQLAQEIIEITWGRKYILCKEKYSFLREDQKPAEDAPQPVDPCPSTHGTSD